MFINYFNSCLLALCFCLIKFQSKLQLMGRKGSGSISVGNGRRQPEQNPLSEKRCWESGGRILPIYPREFSTACIASSFSIFSTFDPPLNAVTYWIKPKSFTERVMRISSLNKLLPSYAILLLSLCWTSEIYGWNRHELKRGTSASKIYDI